jgi:UPF0755 protein
MAQYQPKHFQQDKPVAPKEKRKKQKKNGCLMSFLYFLFIISVSIVLSCIAIFVANDVLALVKEDRTIVFAVDQDTTVGALSDRLEEEGVIEYSSMFKLFVTAAKKDRNVMAGEYELSPSMDYMQLAMVLRNADSTQTVDVTIPEGYTLSQIRETLLNKKVCVESVLDEAINTYPYKHTFLADQQPPAENWLEGYLFPDTYTFVMNTEDAVHDVINKMLNRFDDMYDEKIQEGADALGLSVHEVVTIASLIEREARVESEFETISGVIHNRLNHPDLFPRLQIDAAVQYAVGHKSALTKEDLQIDSPYNTYLYPGLPPGPICCPGYTALYAATHPEEHNYFYYVAKSDGTHLFANSYDQHQNNIAAVSAAE